MGIGSLLSQMAQNPDEVEDAVFDATAPEVGPEPSGSDGLNTVRDTAAAAKREASAVSEGPAAPETFATATSVPSVAAVAAKAPSPSVQSVDAPPVASVSATPPVAKTTLSSIIDTDEDLDEDLTNTDGGDGLVACGDAEVPAQIRKDTPKTTPVFPGDTFACGFAIPPRPRRWPVMMSWPPHREVEILNRPDVTTEMRRKFFAELLAREEKMMKRADVIHDWIATHGGPIGWKEKRRLDALKTDPHNGIRWATLLDAKSSAHAVTAAASRWGHSQCETIDGGRLRATDDGVRVSKATKQAIDLAIREGIARGWSTFEFKGNRKFVELAIQACREANVEATITLNPKLVPGIPGIGFRRKIKIMPNIPGYEEIHPGTGAAAQTEGTPEHRGAEMQKSIKDRLAAGVRARAPENAAEESADDVLDHLDDHRRGPVPDDGRDVAFG